MITSVQNGQIKRIKQLHMKKHRVKSNSFIIEGFHLVEEVVEAGWTIEMVVVREGIDVPSYVADETIIDVTDAVFSYLSQTTSPQGILAVVSMKEHKLKNESLTLLIDAVQDPGNVGTMIRTADAAGFDSVIVGTGSADIYNDKVVRATQGSLFHVDVLQMDLAEAIEHLQAIDTKIIATALEGAIDYVHLDVHEKMALLVGNEGAGVDKQYLQAADQIVKIPIYGKAESLNVSIAASILMYDMKGKIASLK